MRARAESARRAGLDAIGVLAGGFSEQELREAGAVCVFERLEDLIGRAEQDPSVSRLSQHADGKPV
jgi:phosphoglycolate phosphatase-like HAD superfamily hydrolase